MGEIREELILSDRFSAGFSQFISYGERAAGTMEMVDRTIRMAGTESIAVLLHGMGQINQSVNDVNDSIREMGDASRYVMVQGLNEINQTLKQIGQSTQQAADKQENHKKEIDKASTSANKLLSYAVRIASAFGGIKIASGLINLSDTMTQTGARLGMVIDQLDGGLGDIAGLQESIYQSAQRSRGAYLDTAAAVSKMGLMAGDAFGSSGEIVAFMEQINKQFKIAGTEASGIQAAMLQLTQAMGSGVLRGEEYNSILEQAPNIIQTIANYMDMPMGKLKDMAAEGKITADVVKAAVFAAADETNAKFERLPMTYADAWTMVKNAGVNALGEVSDKLNSFLNSNAGSMTINGLISGFEVLSDVASGAIDLMASGAEWVVDNWDYVYPILIGIGAAFMVAGMAGVASGLAAVASWSPITLIAIGIGIAIGALVFGLSQAGIGFEEMGVIAGAVMGGIYTIIYTVIATSWNLFATFAEFFANVFNDPVSAIANLFASLLDTILSVVQTAASAIDALLGSDISGAVAGFRNTVSDFVESKVGANQVKIQRMEAADFSENIAKGADLGKAFGKKLDNLNVNLGDFNKGFGDGGWKGIRGAGNLGLGGGGNIGKVGSVGNVKNVEGEISLADEDLKLYRDLAERKYMNQIELKTLAPNINVTLPAGASGNLTADDVADKIKIMLLQQMSANTAVSHG